MVLWFCQRRLVVCSWNHLLNSDKLLQWRLLVIDGRSYTVLSACWSGVGRRFEVLTCLQPSLTQMIKYELYPKIVSREIAAWWIVLTKQLNNKQSVHFYSHPVFQFAIKLHLQCLLLHNVEKEVVHCASENLSSSSQYEWLAQILYWTNEWIRK